MSGTGRLVWVRSTSATTGQIALWIEAIRSAQSSSAWRDDVGEHVSRYAGSCSPMQPSVAQQAHATSSRIRGDIAMPERVEKMTG